MVGMTGREGEVRTQFSQKTSRAALLNSRGGRNPFPVRGASRACGARGWRRRVERAWCSERGSFGALPNPGREGAARPTRSTSRSGAREDISLLTRLNLLLEKVAELGAPGDVAGVVVRRVEVLVPRRLGQRNLAAEGRHGSWLGRARGRGKVEGLERHSAQQKVTLRGDC